MESIDDSVNEHDHDISHFSEEDIRSVLDLSDVEEGNDLVESTEQEDRDVIRQDNEELYRSQRKVYEIMTIAMCCLILFSTSYSKATPKDMQTKLPSVQKTFEANKQELIFPMGHVELAASLVSAIAMIDTPAIFISPFAGYFVTRWSTRITLIVFTVLCFIGSLLCSLSIWYHIWWWFPVGRFVFGLGVASLRIAINVVIKESVHPDQLGTYMQFPRTAEKLASMSDGWFCSWALIEHAVERSPQWMVLPFMVGSGLIAISLPCFTLFMFEPKNKNEIMDREEREKRNQERMTQQGIEMVTFKTNYDHSDQAEGEREGIQSRESSSIHRTSTYEEVDVIDHETPKTVTPSMIRMMFEKIKSFPLSYWVIIIIFFFNDAATGVYQGVLPQFLNIYNIPKKPDSFWQKPGTVRQIPLYFAIFSPIFGLFVDRSGRRRYILLMVGSIGLVVHHGFNVLMAVGSLNKWSWIDGLHGILYPNLLFQGFCNCFIGAVLFPGIAFVTERSALSIAYGCQASLGSVAGVLFYNIISTLVSKHNALNEHLDIADDAPIPVTIYSVYMTLMFFVAAIISMCLILVFSIYRYDICPPESVDADVSNLTIDIVQDMERRDIDTTIRKMSKKASKIRLRMPRQTRRRTSTHYINRFG